ncbi:hypothetical protein [Hymenobacter cheonanensis]|uniref:hypothetical protein n=1 Tax=Hymenobacter sp. CA2-7 TaxID=3063993 RepID=UPI0027142947|nr:hypothetical protein [Hymenobacter sp. CA2-7]MDO7884724.1 hypothetical protein [Hymenobacter sp. CA2-7]
MRHLVPLAKSGYVTTALGSKYLLGIMCVLACLLHHPAWAAFGIYQDYAIVNPNGAGFQYYAGGANSAGSTAFSGKDFGAFTAGQSLVLGEEIKTFKNNGSNVTGARLYYRVYLVGNTPGGFTQTNPAFSDDNIDGTNGNQKWTNVSNSQGNNTPAPVDLLAGLTASGTYTIEVYWTAQASNEADVVENNANANYKATFSFTVAPMPVALTAFTAQRQGADAQLSWTTATETDNAGYEVQVSLSGEATDFRVLGFVAAPTPTSQTARTYTFRDQEAGKTGLRYYRLRQVDLSGPSTFSPVRSVQFDALAAAQLAAVPNPFGDKLALLVTLPQAATAATLTLTDALGREVLRQPIDTLPAGASKLIISAGTLRAGVYVARLALPTGPQTLRVLKQ